MPRYLFLLIVFVLANLALAFVLLSRERPVLESEPVVREPFDQQIKLVTELPQPAAAAAPAAPQRECRVWGPVEDAAAFAQLRAQLESTGAFPEVQTTQIMADADYLVYLDQLGSRDEARRVTQELSALKIDSYLLTRDTGPIVSVGVFSREPLAQRQQRRMSELGYKVVVERMPRAKEVYVLLAHVQVDSEAYASSVSPCTAFAHSD